MLHPSRVGTIRNQGTPSVALHEGSTPRLVPRGCLTLSSGLGFGCLNAGFWPRAKAACPCAVSRTIRPARPRRERRSLSVLRTPTTNCPNGLAGALRVLQRAGSRSTGACGSYLGLVRGFTAVRGSPVSRRMDELSGMLCLSCGRTPSPSDAHVDINCPPARTRMGVTDVDSPKTA